MLFTKVSNKIHEDMVLLYLTLSNILDNERNKYATHFNGWSVDVPSISYRLHIIVIIIIISLHVGHLG